MTLLLFGVLSNLQELQSYIHLINDNWSKFHEATHFDKYGTGSVYHFLIYEIIILSS